MTRGGRDATPVPPTPLVAVLALSALASVGTSVFWFGLPFIARHDYGYSQERTLVLNLVVGVMYVAGASSASRILRWSGAWLTPRALVAVILCVHAAACAIPLLIRPESDPSGWTLWFVAGLASFLTSLFWPIVESYVTAGRHGAEMRRALGWFNVVWTSAVAVTLVVMAPLIEGETARWAIVGSGVVSFAAVATLAWFGVRPGHHDEEIAKTHLQQEYPALLRSARVLLPLSYLCSSALAPLLPYLLADLDVAPFWAAPAAATWMVLRVVGMVALWRLRFWHGRWATLLLAALGTAVGFAVIVAAQSLPVLLIGLALFGVALAVIYYAALYYAMAVGRAAVDASGTHEALIGVGYAAGPLVALVGLGAARAVDGVSDAAGIITMIWVVIVLVGITALRPYLSGRKARR